MQQKDLEDIVQIFEEVAVGDHNERPVTSEMFNLVLGKMAKLEPVNEIGCYYRDNAVTNTIEVPVLNNVSISNFSIIEIDNLYGQAIASLYGNTTWSHPLALRLLLGVNDKSLKQYLIKERKMSLWYWIKRFYNSIPGVLNARGWNLKIDVGFNQTSFKTICKKIVLDSIHPFCYDTPIVIDVDRVLIGRLPDETWYTYCRDVDQGVSVISHDDKDRAYIMLNQICRKYKLDIIP